MMAGRLLYRSIASYASPWVCRHRAAGVADVGEVEDRHRRRSSPEIAGAVDSLERAVDRERLAWC